MSSHLLLVLLLAALAASPAVCQRPRERCGFQTRQPRFFSTRTPITALNVGPQAFFLSDALLRTITRQLGVAQCQVRLLTSRCCRRLRRPTAARPAAVAPQLISPTRLIHEPIPKQVLLSEGEACSAALAAAPCPDPLWLCDGQLTTSNSVYQAARMGLCSTTAGTATAAGNAAQAGVCQTLRDYPAIATYAAADACIPTCMAQLTPSSAENGTSSLSTLAPPPPPRAAGGCWAFWLQLDAASEEDAAEAAANLHNATTAGALLDSLASFSAPGPGRINFLMGDSGARGRVAWGGRGLAT